MATGRRSCRWSGPTLAVATAMLAAGCAEELGPVPMPAARVRGIVKEGPRPVSGGWIEFVPVDGTIGNLRSARLGTDGTFDADRVAVGTVAIRLVNVRMETRGYQPLFSAFSSPIRRKVTENASGPIVIDLVEEAIQFQRDRDRIKAGAARPAGDRP
jgi:hypothetical protein